jgi:predicted unusual protein kinase regulating ubiquinone biosynthesis (AarF/ABC1/UbiB family)
VAIDRLADPRQPREHRDHVAAALTRLSVREFFEMRLVQTDPNFGNYLFDAETGRIALIDFGATEVVSPRLVEQLRGLGRALRDGDAAAMRQLSLDIGFIAEGDPPQQSQGILDIMHMASEPLRHVGPFDFAASDLFKRTFAQGRAQFFGAGFARTPPPDMLFLQRKFAGMFMTCARLGARVDLAEVFGVHL